MEFCQAVAQPVRQRIQTDDRLLQGRGRSEPLICAGLEAA